MFIMLTIIEFFDKDAIKNILAVLSIKPDKVVFLYDKEIRNMNFFLGLRRCFKRHFPEIIFEKYPVDIGSIPDIYEKTVQIIEENEKCMIELTGGSELMMIGAYKAGRDKNVEMVYTDIIAGKIIGIDDNSNVRKTASLSLNDFIDARGACFIGNSHHEPEEKRYQHILKMSRIIFENLKAWKNTCMFLQTAMAESSPSDLELKSRCILMQRDGRKVQPDRSLLSSFQKNGFIRELNFTSENIRFEFTSKESKSYMINFGVWLELFVFISAKMAGQFEDVKLGTMIDWNAYDGITIAGNEIDVILTDNSLPVFISCKMRDADTAAINELLIAKKRLGGWFSKGILITFGNDKSAKTGTYKRAQELGIEILDKQDITSKDFVQRFVRTVQGHDLIGLKWKYI